jgi:hypothetical protein
MKEATNDLLTLTQAEIATNCVVSRFTFRQLAVSKKIAASKVDGKWRIPVHAVAELMVNGYRPQRGRPRKVAA